MMQNNRLFKNVTTIKAISLNYKKICVQKGQLRLVRRNSLY